MYYISIIFTTCEAETFRTDILSDPVQNVL